LDHGGGPAESSNVPTAIQTPVSFSCDAFSDGVVAGGEGLQPDTASATAPENRSARNTSGVRNVMLLKRSEANACRDLETSAS
jgi:hypothetical protein